MRVICPLILSYKTKMPLKKIPNAISPHLLQVLALMGHGDEIGQTVLELVYLNGKIL
jgi:hypothetical protein